MKSKPPVNKPTQYSLVALELKVGESRDLGTNARARLCRDYGAGKKLKMQQRGTIVTRLQ